MNVYKIFISLKYAYIINVKSKIGLKIFYTFNIILFYLIR